jgi:hypothetical protein
MFGSLLLLVATETLVATPIEEPDPKAMSQSEIRAFNAKLNRTHPFYIRCEKREETGTLVRKLYSCRTNAQWHASDATGNDNAREIGDHFRPKFLLRE